MSHELTGCHSHACMVSPPAAGQMGANSMKCYCPEWKVRRVIAALQAENQRLLGQVAGLQTDNEVLEKQVSRQRMQIHGARKMIKYGRGARDRLVAENQRLQGELQLARETLAAYANDEDAYLRGDGEPYGSIPTEVGLVARQARSLTIGGDK